MNREHLDLAPIRRVRGTVRLPGSKSISNRILLLAALAQGETRIRDLLESDDTRVMLEALRALGVQCVDEGARGLRVRGAGGAFPVKKAELFLGNAGTAFRPLTAVLALCAGEYRLSGVAAHARAADRRPGRRAAPARRPHRIPREGRLSAARRSTPRRSARAAT